MTDTTQTPAADSATPTDATQTPGDAQATTAEQSQQGQQQDQAQGQEQQQGQQQAPEAYQWTMPEGMTLDPAALAAYGDAAKALGLPQDQAQSIIDRVAPAMAQAQAEQAQAMVKGWEAAAHADTEIGGDKLPETLAIAKRALSEFGSPALSEFLDASGLGSHPEVIRLLAKAGRALGADTIPARGNGPGTDGRSVAQRLFPSMPTP